MLRGLEKYYEDYCKSIRQEAEVLREGPMPVITEELFAVYENTGNRLIYEEAYFMRRKFLAVFGLKVILDREERDIRKLEEILKDICGEECWALPAHVNRKLDKSWRIYVDLFAAETGQALAEIVSLLRDVLASETADIVRREVTRRVLEPFSASRAPYGHWEYGAGNWCAVCGGSVGSAAMYLMRDRPEELDALLERICHSLENYYLKSFAEDGACLEGLGYFTYGMTYFTGFADQLYAFTEGKRNLFQIEKLWKIAAFQAKCYFRGGKTVSFADGFTDDTFRPGLTCCLAMKYPGAGIPAMERAAGLNDDNCYRWMGLYRNLTWTKDYMEALRQGEIGETGKGSFVKPEAMGRVPERAFFTEKESAEAVSAGRAGLSPEGTVSAGGAGLSPEGAGLAGGAGLSPEGAGLAGVAELLAAGTGNSEAESAAQIVLPDAQWTICQSANGAGMAAKGGHNGEPHNHNDVGSFFYLKGTDFLLADLGCGEYTRDYFSWKRYEYLCCRSLGHNVPIIDGREQHAGEGYGCDGFETDGLGRTTISFAGAYANPELKALVRTLEWNVVDGTLQVEDCFEITQRLRSVRENLITCRKPEIKDNTIRIQGAGNGCVIAVEGRDVKIECSRQDFSDHSGICRDVWLLQWEVPLAGAVGQVTARFSVTAL